MTHPLIAELVAEGPVLIDGAWGTQLQAQGLPAGHRPDVLNLSDPDRVAAVAQSYVDAGSRIILTNTFQANRFALGPDAADVTAINRAGAEISRGAAGNRAKVFGSMGPSNKLLITGEVDEAELHELFTEQASALGAGGADGIVIETMSDLAEAVIALRAARTTGLPVVACMTYDTGKKNDRTMMGVTPAQAAEELTSAGADVIGANCGAGVDIASPICAALADATTLPVWIKANAGTPELVDRQVVYQMTPAEFAGHVDDVLAAGATFVGGCCGTTPEFIAAVRERLG
jgi:methionine synthase I (cobalamin-dependent)